MKLKPLAAAASLVVLAACGSGSGTPTASSTATAVPGTPVTITGTDGLKFTPNVVTATAGAITINFSVPGGTPHNFEVEGIVGAQIRSLLSDGQSRTITFTAKPGKYTFLCTIHNGMSGTLNVVAAP